MKNTDIIPWENSHVVDMPKDLSEPDKIVVYANALSEKQQGYVIKAFNNGAYDMGSEYIWKRSMTKLRSTLEKLGAKFIGEMLGRNDIDEFSNIESVLTDYNTIQLAEQLGVINSTASLKLKQASEILNHYFSEKAIKEKEEIDLVEAISIVKDCVKYILSTEDVGTAIKFSKFRDKILNESFIKNTEKENDPDLQQIIDSPVFYLRTTIVVLINAIKSEKGAKRDHGIDNLITIIPSIWENIPDRDKWEIGFAYRDVTAEGNERGSIALKKALLSVSGFDYVPENLRSNTFKQAAKALLDVHFAMNNFYNEPIYINYLSNLGTRIPNPAFFETIQAYLCVYLGNRYGFAWNAIPIAKEQLKKLSNERWNYYFRKLIQFDDIILYKLMEEYGAERFSNLINEIDLPDFKDISSKNERLLRYLKKKNILMIKEIAENMYLESKVKG